MAENAEILKRLDEIDRKLDLVIAMHSSGGRLYGGGGGGPGGPAFSANAGGPGGVAFISLIDSEDIRSASDGLAELKDWQVVSVGAAGSGEYTVELNRKDGSGGVRGTGKSQALATMDAIEKAKKMGPKAA